VHTFSVVIASRNRQALLAETLQAFKATIPPRDRLDIVAP